MAKGDFKSVDEYIEAQHEAVRDTIELVRATIRKAIPQAQEAISYNMPTYSLNGDRLLHFAVWKEHYAIYAATERVVKEFEKELASYEVEKGTIRFPLSKPAPVKLIGRIVKISGERSGERGKAEEVDKGVERDQASAAQSAGDTFTPSRRSSGT